MRGLMHRVDRTTKLVFVFASATWVGMVYGAAFAFFKLDPHGDIYEGRVIGPYAYLVIKLIEFYDFALLQGQHRFIRLALGALLWATLITVAFVLARRLRERRASSKGV